MNAIDFLKAVGFGFAAIAAVMLLSIPISATISNPTLENFEQLTLVIIAIGVVGAILFYLSGRPGNVHEFMDAPLKQIAEETGGDLYTSSYSAMLTFRKGLATFRFLDEGNDSNYFIRSFQTWNATPLKKSFVSVTVNDDGTLDLKRPQSAGNKETTGKIIEILKSPHFRNILEISQRITVITGGNFRMPLFNIYLGGRNMTFMAAESFWPSPFAPSGVWKDKVMANAGTEYGRQLYARLVESGFAASERIIEIAHG